MVELQKRPNKRVISSRIIRPNTPDNGNDEWAGTTPSERIEAVWELTRQCLAWNRDANDEPRLDRSVTRIKRAWR